ncbi:MAG TPA: shikimate kinase [Bacteroidales bacterium]|jgi:shikimate kinase|nr:shikimate kinase [Bacteroidales bacterium]
MRYFLIGFMGSGKSTIGNQLARYLNIDFFDLDKYIEKNTRSSIQTIFETEGEEVFRKYESKYLKQIIAASSQSVISTGGGTPCYYDNLQVMQQNGIVIYLKQNTNTLAKRILTSKTKRPLIKNMGEKELLQWIEDKLAERGIYYNQANLIIEAQNINAATLVSYLEHFNL